MRRLAVAVSLSIALGACGGPRPGDPDLYGATLEFIHDPPEWARDRAAWRTEIEYAATIIGTGPEFVAGLRITIDGWHYIDGPDYYRTAGFLTGWWSRDDDTARVAVGLWECARKTAFLHELIHHWLRDGSHEAAIWGDPRLARPNAC